MDVVLVNSDDNSLFIYYKGHEAGIINFYNCGKGEGCYLELIEVDPIYRGKGIGRKVVELFKEKMKNEGVAFY